MKHRVKNRPEGEEQFNVEILLLRGGCGEEADFATG